MTTQVDDMQRLRVEKMERQLANLTGLVQKALQVPGPTPAPAAAPRQEFQTYQPRPATTGKIFKTMLAKFYFTSIYYYNI